MGSAAALARASYDLPHAALFSTGLLRDWFAVNAIGVFAAGREHGERRSVTFDNAITPVGPVEADDLRAAGPRRLLFYARPEEHASRNLFEVGMMALDAAIASGAVLDGWELAGVGTVELGGGALELPSSGAALRLVPRGPQADYARMLRSFDVGPGAHVHAPPEPRADRDGGRRDGHGDQHVREQGRRGARGDLVQPDRGRAHGRGRRGRLGGPRRAPASSVTAPAVRGSPGRRAGTRRWVTRSSLGSRTAGARTLRKTPGLISFRSACRVQQEPDVHRR